MDDRPTRRRSRSLSLHSQLRRDPLRVLEELARWWPAELAGSDLTAVTTHLENEVAARLGKPAAVWFPSGKMAQQIALRLHADDRSHRTFAGHPATHVAVWEEQGYAVVHDLVFRAVGDPHRLLQLDDLSDLPEAPGVVTWELPQRDIGGQLPGWTELTAQVAWAREHGAAAHCDGARIWQCAGFYRRPLAEIASLFDTVYVSLYKDLEAPRGAVLCGPEKIIDRSRLWRRRLGGEIPDAWPLTAAALMGLQRTLPRMPIFQQHANRLADAITRDGLASVVPYPIHAPMFHVHLPIPADRARRAHHRIEQQSGVQLLLKIRSNPDPGRCSFEVVVGENALEITPRETTALIRQLVTQTT